jgi:hypothetical protein
MDYNNNYLQEENHRDYKDYKEKLFNSLLKEPQ